ncbi:MAG: hypothetical protein ACRDLP_06095 [Solirubrobacteraceae bacterium]
MPAERLEELRAEARHARQRYDLYKARTYGPRPTTESRLAELRRECDGAEERLRAAEARPSSRGAGERTP